jgi:Derlin-2/3
MAGQSLETFFAEMPVVTKFWLCASFLSTLGVMLKIISPMNLLLDFEVIWSKFQIWRLLTCACFFGKFSFPFMFQLYFLVSYGKLYESDPFPTGGGASSDFCYMLLIGSTIWWAVGYVLGFRFIGESRGCRSI